MTRVLCNPPPVPMAFRFRMFLLSRKSGVATMSVRMILSDRKIERYGAKKFVTRDCMEIFADPGTW